jgi:hypothetical protein
MAIARKGRFGVGLLLVLLGGCNAVRWREAGLNGGAEMGGYFALSAVMIVAGLWFIFRKYLPSSN